MNNISRTVLLGAALLALVVGILVGWLARGSDAPPPDVATISFYEDWRLTCPAVAQKGACALSENLIDTKSHVQVAQLALTSSDKGKALVVTTPFDVLLGSGVGITVGNGKPRVYPFLTCTSAGCVAQVPVDDAMLASLRQEQSGKIFIAGLNNQTASINFSLKGFKRADDAAQAHGHGRRFLGMDI